MNRVLVVVAAALLCCASFAGAQENYGESIEISAFANYWNVKDGDDNVWGPGIGLGVPLYKSFVRLDVRASWLPDVGTDGAGDLQLVPLDLGLSLHTWVGPDCNIDLYAMGGATYAFADFDSDVSGLDIDDGWGAYAGAGAAYMFTENLGFFTNVYYRTLELDAKMDTHLIIFDVGDFDASGVSVDVGLKYAF